MTQDQIRAAAGRAYLAAVKPYNSTLKKLYNRYKDKTSLKALRTYCSKLDENLRKWISKLKTIEWPTDTASDAKALIKSNAAEDAHLRACAKAKTQLAWLREFTLYGKAGDKGVEAANLVRLDLGLDPVG
jgi:hypothetical protein